VQCNVVREFKVSRLLTCYNWNLTSGISGKAPTVSDSNSSNTTSSAQNSVRGLTEFEAWLKNQPIFDLNLWMKSMSTKNESDPRSEDTVEI
jgi:hypothetical protein